MEQQNSINTTTADVHSSQESAFIKSNQDVVSVSPNFITLPAVSVGTSITDCIGSSFKLSSTPTSPIATSSPAKILGQNLNGTCKYIFIDYKWPL